MRSAADLIADPLMAAADDACGAAKNSVPAAKHISKNFRIDSLLSTPRPIDKDARRHEPGMNDNLLAWLY